MKINEKLLRKYIEQALLSEQVSEDIDLQSGKLYKWQDFQDGSSVPLAGSSGIGPGENRLAALLNGEVQGQSQSFDLQVGNDRWEVKAPDRDGGIRPGTEGLAAYAPLNTILSNAMAELNTFVKTPGAENIFPDDAWDQLSDFLSVNANLISRGEVTQKRFDEIIRVFNMVGATLADLEGDEISQIEIGGKKYNVTPTALVRISKMVGLSDEDIEEEMGPGAAQTLLLSILRAPVFSSTEELDELWDNSINPDEVFDLTGIILVNRDGFMPVRSPYGDKVKFTRVTQAKPRFKVPMSGQGKMDESNQTIQKFIRESLMSEELTKSDKKEIEKIAKKQAMAHFDSQIAKAIDKELGKSYFGTKGKISKHVDDAVSSRFKNADKDKDFDDAVIRISKRVLKALHDMHYKRTGLIDRMPVPKK